MLGPSAHAFGLEAPKKNHLSSDFSGETMVFLWHPNQQLLGQATDASSCGWPIEDGGEANAAGWDEEIPCIVPREV